MKLKPFIYLMSYSILTMLSATACADSVKPESGLPDAIQASSADPINAADVERLGKTLEIIKRYYVETVPNKELFDNALRGMLSGLDPHSSFLDEKELKELKEVTTGLFSGLGIEVSSANGFLKVITPLDDSPAQKAGVKAGDYIIKINDELVKDMSLSDAINKMRGAKGSSVDLTLLRTDTTHPIKLKLTREFIKIESVKSKMLEPGYGYVRIGSFQENTATALVKAVEDLQRQTTGPLKGLMLDLRNNPGGLLEPSAKVADEFLNPKKTSDNDIIVSAKGRYPGSDFAIKADPDDIIPGVPMVVLINQGSASGAEIVAGALQDYKRAVLVGTDSFGKGSVQTVIPLDNKSAIKLTTALYYTPNGRSIQASAIHPDVVVDDIQIPAKKDILAEEKIYIKEVDLKGHLANGNKKIATTVNSVSLDKPNAATALASDDYQLAVALNILKGLAAVQPSKK